MLSPIGVFNRRPTGRAGFLLALSLIGHAWAQESDDAALALADRTTAEPTAHRVCVEYAEGAASETTYSDTRPPSAGGRASFSLRCDGVLASRWRAVFSDRFDYFWARGNSAQAVNTLKEGYLSFRGGGSELLDFGRVNVRQGAAVAYNPTDYFRADSVRAVVSINPETLRDERLGTLMVRSQTLWPNGSLTGIFAPRLRTTTPDSATFSPDFGATNHWSRWVVVLSERLAEGFQPQWVLTGREHQSLQVGLNLTSLINSATVAYLEWSGARSPGNVAQSGYGPSAPSDRAFHSRLSTGLTYTTSYNLSLTAEYQYDEAAPDRKEWIALRNGPVAPYVQYRQYAAVQGELATRQNLFGYAHWEDVGIDHLGVTVFVRFDPYDRSHVTWGEARYHWTHAGIAVQWQGSRGDAKSDLAPRPQRQSWLALMDYYF